MFNFLKSVIFKQDNINNSEYNALVGSIEDTIDTLQSDVGLIKQEMVIPTSSGDWLNTYGAWFGVTRLVGEDDQSYAGRIIASTTFPKDTVAAIIAAANQVAGYTGDLTTLYEPWKNIARYNMSSFSGKDVIQDGEYWLPATIDISTPYPVTPSVQYAVQSVKSAGVKVYYSVTNVINMDDDTNSFADDFTATSQVTLDYEMPMAQYYSGGTFDTNVGQKRTRSGTQSLITDTTISLELDEADASIDLVMNSGYQLSDFMYSTGKDVSGNTIWASNVTLGDLMDYGSTIQGGGASSTVSVTISSM